MPSRARYVHDHGTPEKERACQLLYSILTPYQRRVMREEGFIPVRGSDGNRWRIFIHSNQNNCKRFARYQGKGRWVSRCAHLPYILKDRDRYGQQQWTYFPLADHHLAQLLVIQTDEASFWKTSF